MDIFSRISVLLLLLSIPLWIYRATLFARLDSRAKSILRRVIARHESAYAFCARIFGFLIVFSGLIFAFIYALSFIKHGGIKLKSFSDTFPRRVYSGLEQIDTQIDALLYDQILPVMVLLTVLLLSVSFTLFMTAIRDIRLIRRLKRRLSLLQERMASARNEGSLPVLPEPQP
ncbi:hypothetical protein [Roseibium sp.]|uniref:hypothetical protein n=1 Tax=Roseibium sp. TaxID=1936156 RepID=UPI003A978583